jgi:acetyl esterase/lipase
MNLMFRIGCLLGACTADAPLLAEAASGVLLHDIEYGRAGGEVLLLDAAVPAGEGPFSAVILVHGGGWTGGSKAGDIAVLIEPLAKAGFVCFSINYRLAPQHRWPACRDDVLTAIRWVKEHAAEFKGDSARIALIGCSAGGHLVCSAAIVVNDSVRVQAVVGLAPPTHHLCREPLNLA